MVTSAVADAIENGFTEVDTLGSLSSNGAAPVVLSDEIGASFTYAGETTTIFLETGENAASEREGSITTFEEVADDTDAAVRTEGSSAQLLAVMRTPDSSTEQRYTLDVPEGTEVVPSDGGYLLVKDDAVVIGAISAPWAVDAEGKSLPTTYELQGSTLVQRTDTVGAAFPVVADPKLTYGWGVYLNMWGHELKATAIAAIAAGGTAVAVGCTLTSNLPHPVLKSIANLACGAGAVSLPKVWDAMKSVYRSNATENTACYQMKIIPTGGTFTKVSSSNCR